MRLGQYTHVGINNIFTKRSLSDIDQFVASCWHVLNILLDDLCILHGLVLQRLFFLDRKVGCLSTSRGLLCWHIGIILFTTFDSVALFDHALVA